MTSRRPSVNKGVPGESRAQLLKQIDAAEKVLEATLPVVMGAMAGQHSLFVTVVACHPGNRRPDPAAAYVAASAVDPAQTAFSGHRLKRL
jgi:hypothetical protein